MKKKLLFGFLTAIASVLLGGSIFLSTLMPIITGYAAKNLCSGIFVSGREKLEIESLDLNFMPIKFTKNTVDFTEKSVTSRFLWGSSKAIYRNGYGVTLIRDINISELSNDLFPLEIDAQYSRDTVNWPMGDLLSDTLPGDYNKGKLDFIANDLVDAKGYNGTAFAFIVLKDGFPVVERYVEGFDKDTRLLSWSMAKSVTNALTGILTVDGKIDIFQPTGISEWQGDLRKDITWNDLMQMQSGLEWNEDYGSKSDVNVMLHCEGDMAKYAIKKELADSIGEKWYYSSGSTNIISYLIKNEFDSVDEYYSFTYNNLFYKIGITDAVFEVDPSGTLVGSSYLYATARDFARFGLLYLNDGVFAGERVLPDGWVEYTTNEASNSEGKYGSFFWLNKGKTYGSAPEDMFYCTGHDGQQIFIIPSENTVIVVLGYSPKSDGGMNFDKLLGDVLSCF